MGCLISHEDHLRNQLVKSVIEHNQTLHGGLCANFWDVSCIIVHDTPSSAWKLSCHVMAGRDLPVSTVPPTDGDMPIKRGTELYAWKRPTLEHLCELHWNLLKWLTALNSLNWWITQRSTAIPCISVLSFTHVKYGKHLVRGLTCYQFF